MTNIENDIKKIIAVLEETKREEATKEYTLTPQQRNIAFTFSESGFHGVEETEANIRETLGEGYFNTKFNSNHAAQEFMIDLMDLLGHDGYELRNVVVREGAIIPGFNFKGFPVKGKIVETRLFKINS